MAPSGNQNLSLPALLQNSPSSPDSSSLVSDQPLPVLSHAGRFLPPPPGPDLVILPGLPACLSLFCQVHLPWTRFLSPVRLGRRAKPCVYGRQDCHPFPCWGAPWGPRILLTYRRPLVSACWSGLGQVSCSRTFVDSPLPTDQGWISLPVSHSCPNWP